MTEQRPPSYEELVEQNAALVANNARLRSSLGSLQAEIVRKDAELARALRPKASPRKLDPAAKDSFARPFRG